MRIGIDGRYQGRPLAGITRYIDEICKQLDILLPDAEFFLYTQNADGICLPSKRWQCRPDPSRFFSRIKPLLWWKLRVGYLIQKDRIDVLWAGVGMLPGNVGNVSTVLTVHDLTFRLYPQTMARFNLWAHRLYFRSDLKKADFVLAVSEGTNRRLINFYGRAADAIVRPNAAKHFKPESSEKQLEVRARYNLKMPFLLAVSTLEPRKNLIRLIEAFVLLKHAGTLPDYELALVGNRGWRNSTLEKMIDANEGFGIRRLGFVPDTDLPTLYSACEVFCMPSLYEGFGIPVLEARRCGARVLATDIPELREAGDASCVYTAPDAPSIAGGIKRVLAAPNQKFENKTNGEPWREATKRMLPFLSPRDDQRI